MKVYCKYVTIRTTKKNLNKGKTIKDWRKKDVTDKQKSVCVT